MSDYHAPRPTLLLAESLGYHMRTLTETWGALLQRRLGPLGGTFPQWRYLRELWEEDGLTQRELSDRVGRQAATTVMALRILQRGGLIKVARAPEDRRKQRVFLTKKGRALSETMMPTIIEIEEAVLSGVPDNELTIFKRTLARMQENVDAAILNQNQVARTRLWLLMKASRQLAPRRGTVRRRA